VGGRSEEEEGMCAQCMGHRHACACVKNPVVPREIVVCGSVVGTRGGGRCKAAQAHEHACLLAGRGSTVEGYRKDPGWEHGNGRRAEQSRMNQNGKVEKRARHWRYESSSGAAASQKVSPSAGRTAVSEGRLKAAGCSCPARAAGAAKPGVVRVQPHVAHVPAKLSMPP